VGGHGLHHVGDGDDPGLQEDLVPLETPGIAAAVAALVVLIINKILWRSI